MTAQYTTSSHQPGQIVTPSGEVVGEHRGLWNYTIGQGAKISGSKQRLFVSGKNQEKNQVVVVPGRSVGFQSVLVMT